MSDTVDWGREWTFDMADHVTAWKLEDGTFRIRCKQGLWCVEGFNFDDVLAEAKHYFVQYAMDGEYDSVEERR